MFRKLSRSSITMLLTIILLAFSVTSFAEELDPDPKVRDHEITTATLNCE